jgi:hypothetical protein
MTSIYAVVSPAFVPHNVARTYDSTLLEQTPMSRRNFGFERNPRNTSKRNIGFRADTEFLEPRALMASNVADAPVVRSVVVPEPRTFGNGQAISFVLKFNERVEVDADAVIPVEVGIGRRTAHYASGSGSRSIVFRMNVTDNDIDTDGIRLGQIDEVTGEYDFDFAGGVRDADGNSASDTIPRVDTRGIRVDAIGPRITGMTDFIVKGNVISVYVKFDRPLRFSTPTIGGAITVPAPGSLRRTVLERLNSPYIDFEIDGEPAKLKFVPGNQGVQTWNGMVRSARFVYIDDRDRETEKLSLAFSKIKENQSLIVIPHGYSGIIYPGHKRNLLDDLNRPRISNLTITQAGSSQAII